MLSVDGLEQLVEPVLNQMGLVLHHAELKREGKELVLRVVTDRVKTSEASEGVSIDDLERANHEIGAVLDLEDPIEERYRLTVESPGIERELGTWRQVTYAQNERVHVVTRGADAGVEEGVLTGVTEEPKSLVLKRDDGSEVTVAYSAVKSARTVFVWPTTNVSKKRQVR